MIKEMKKNKKNKSVEKLSMPASAAMAKQE